MTSNGSQRVLGERAVLWNSVLAACIIPLIAGGPLRNARATPPPQEPNTQPHASQTPNPLTAPTITADCSELRSVKYAEINKDSSQPSARLTIEGRWSDDLSRELTHLPCSNATLTINGEHIVVPEGAMKAATGVLSGGPGVFRYASDGTEGGLFSSWRLRVDTRRGRWKFSAHTSEAPWLRDIFDLGEAQARLRVGSLETSVTMPSIASMTRYTSDIKTVFRYSAPLETLICAWGSHPIAHATDCPPPPPTCATGGVQCHDDATCVGADDSATCLCNEGFDGDGFICTDVDECSEGIHGCHGDARCINTAGGNLCACRYGFFGDGNTCTPVNSCAPQECAADATACAPSTCGERYYGHGHGKLDVWTQGVSICTPPSPTRRPRFSTSIPYASLPLSRSTPRPKVGRLQTGNNWAAQIEGAFYARAAGAHSFELRLGSGDNARMLVNGVQVVRPRCSWNPIRSGEVHLEEGMHQISLLYWDDGLPDALDLKVRAPGSDVYLPLEFSQPNAPPQCGNGVRETGEVCDGDCAIACDDAPSCTLQTFSGSASTCSAICTRTAITQCIDGDGCCAPGCNAANDSDCAPLCGNDIVEPGEICDGDCPTSCDDGQICTLNTLTGSASSCSASCSHMPFSHCAAYTLEPDFERGTSVNLAPAPAPAPEHALQLDDQQEAFQFLWVAIWTQGTVVKINTRSGEVLAEYRTAPAGMGMNPSRTTVDKNGNVWVANRDESGLVRANHIAPGLPPADRLMGSVTHIGLRENGECVDRNGNGVIDTSTGLHDVRPWTNSDGADALGGTSTADDECIIHFSRVNSHGTRHVSVDANNNVWVSGVGGRFFDLIDGETGRIIRQESTVGYGGYGGLIDDRGVIWSARSLLRWDTALPLDVESSRRYRHDSYGLCIDSAGNVWNTAVSGNAIHKLSPQGDLLGTYQHGNRAAQGCVVDENDHIWVAHSLLSGRNTVGHLASDGSFLGNVTLDPETPAGPTGVAVDADGFIWATGHNSRRVYKIDPNLGPIGADGITPIGSVILRTVDLGGNLYNYSDMTGSTLTGAPSHGTWEVIHDSTVIDAPWSNISWNAAEPGDATIAVKVASSADGLLFGPAVLVRNGDAPSIAPGRYLKVTVSFIRGSSDGNGDGFDDSPILHDITLIAH